MNEKFHCKSGLEVQEKLTAEAGLDKRVIPMADILKVILRFCCSILRSLLYTLNLLILYT